MSKTAVTGWRECDVCHYTIQEKDFYRFDPDICNKHRESGDKTADATWVERERLTSLADKWQADGEGCKVLNIERAKGIWDCEDDLRAAIRAA